MLQPLQGVAYTAREDPYKIPSGGLAVTCIAANIEYL